MRLVLGISDWEYKSPRVQSYLYELLLVHIQTRPYGTRNATQIPGSRDGLGTQLGTHNFSNKAGPFSLTITPDA